MDSLEVVYKCYSFLSPKRRSSDCILSYSALLSANGLPVRLPVPGLKGRWSMIALFLTCWYRLLWYSVFCSLCFLREHSFEQYFWLGYCGIKEVPQYPHFIPVPTGSRIFGCKLVNHQGLILSSCLGLDRLRLVAIAGKNC